MTAASENTETANRGLRTLSVIDNSFYKLINGMEQHKHRFSSSLRATYLQSSTYSGFLRKAQNLYPLLPHESLQENVFFSPAFLLLEVHDLTVQYTVCIIQTSTPLRRNVCLRR